MSAKRACATVLCLASLPALLHAGPNTTFMSLFSPAEYAGRHVEAESYELPVREIDGQWEGIIAASDGKTYFAVSSHSPGHNGQFFSFDPKTGEVEHIIDIGRWCGETDSIGKRQTQGKIHSQIYEIDGKLYATSTSGHMPEGFPYKGGHFLSYDLATGRCADLGEYSDTAGGLLTMYYEPVYKRLYAISQGDQTLVYYDLDKEKIVEVGSIENNPHQCRMLISDRHGNVYGSTWGGVIYKYDPKRDSMTCLLTRLPHDPNAPQPEPGPMNFREVTTWQSRISGWHGTKWGAVVWDPAGEWFYMVRENDEYLMRLRLPDDPKSHRCTVEGLAPFGYAPSGKYQPRHASLALVLRGRTLWYVSYTPWRVMTHLMSYDIETGKVTNHGPIVTDGGRRVAEVHAMVLGPEDRLHCVAGVWSVKGQDPANDWGGAERAGCYYHARLLVIDPQADLKNRDKPVGPVEKRMGQR